MALLAGLCTVLACIGVIQSLVGWRLVANFTARPVRAVAARPAVTVLKPLHGDEPLLEAALASFCQQQYPAFQIVFGVADRTDPAVGVVERLRARFPRCDIALVIDPACHGPNLKVGNLINMLPAAHHDVLVVADSDIHVQPDYLERLVQALERPGVGLVTTLYVGRPVLANPVGRLGALQITQTFLPGALMARRFGRRDCLGATMCLRRADLMRIGGFGALVNHLADDNVLGRGIAGLGLDVALADTVPLTTVPEVRFGALFRHELRWARTIRALEPLGFVASILQYPLFWALLAMVLSRSEWSLGLFCLAWVLRAIAARGVDRALANCVSSNVAGGVSSDTAAGQGHRMPISVGSGGRSSPATAAGEIQMRLPCAAGLAFSSPVWLLPIRDILSVAVLLASYGGRRVDWRGHGLLADTPPRTLQPDATLRPIEGTNAR